MPHQGDGAKDSAEREQTDKSLRKERSQTDRALAERQQAIEDEADNVIAVARDAADAVLDAARGKADRRVASSATLVSTQSAISEERVAEDAAVQHERDAADESVRSEREDTARTLQALIPLEREKTDRHLLTERERWDEAVANRDDFLGIVSHDLRGLLGGIVNAATLLTMKASDSDDGRLAVAQATRIRRYAARMNRLIADLVDVASIEAGKLSVVPTLGDAAALLAEVADTFEPAASAKGIAVEMQIEERPLQAVFDYPRTLQVLTNLVSNALKFTPAGGQIVVGVERHNGGLRFAVSDTGPGIPPHQLDAVFERFWQVNESDGRGLGLGLYISRCIVDAHRGRVWAENREPSGTTFYITLPGEIAG